MVECYQYTNGDVFCNDSFWYTDKGIIIKWIILGVLFAIFFGWFVGGYIHAKRRLKKGLPLLGYHRFLISYSERKRHGQVPQNHFTFYAQQQPYYTNGQPYQQRPGGPYAEPPPMYNGSDAPPQYFAPQPANKPYGQQGPSMEMPQYGGPTAQSSAPQGPQQSGVVGGDVEQGQSSQQLPPRPKAAMTKLMDRFRR